MLIFATHLKSLYIISQNYVEFNPQTCSKIQVSIAPTYTETFKGIFFNNFCYCSMEVFFNKLIMKVSNHC